MSTLRKLAALIHWNLHCQVAGDTATALSIHADPGELLERTKGWLPNIVRDLAATDQCAHVRMIDAAALGPMPGMARDVPIRTSLPAGAAKDGKAGQFLQRWAFAIDALRVTVHNHAPGASDHSFLIALWLAASVLTAQVVVASPLDSTLVVYIPADMPADPIGDRERALELARLLQPATLLVLPIYQRVKQSAFTDVQMRLRAYADVIRRRGRLDSHAELTEFKHLLYFMERISSIKLAFPPNMIEGDKRAARQQQFLVQHKHAATLADAKEMMRLARVQPQYLNRNDNYGLTNRGKVRFTALLALALRRDNLLRPAVFAAFGSLSRRRKIAARLRDEGLTVAEILALCGVVPSDDADTEIRSEVDSDDPK